MDESADASGPMSPANAANRSRNPAVQRSEMVSVYRKPASQPASRVARDKVPIVQRVAATTGRWLNAISAFRLHCSTETGKSAVIFFRSMETVSKTLINNEFFVAALQYKVL
jgi:hypothetical protein